MKNVIKKLNEKLNHNINELIDKKVFNSNKSNNNYTNCQTITANSWPRRKTSIDRRRAPTKPSAIELVANCGQTSTDIMASDMTLSPIRSLDDFLSANRYRLPQYKDIEKWNRRVVHNLLYFQTNYFLTAIIIFTLIGIVKPTQILLGLLAMLIAIAIFIYANNKSPQFMDFKRSHPFISLMLIFGGGSLIVYLFSAVLVFLFGILLPIFLVLLHASLRTRSIKNKIANTMETVGITKTPMGLLLDSFGSDPEKSFY